MQGVVFSDIDPRPAGVSEDCLYLNIWTPALQPEKPIPVMVWIHGGGFVVGSGAEPRYDGTNLAARGIIVVTLNHRLNALGFFDVSFSVLRTETISAIYERFVSIEDVAGKKNCKKGRARATQSAQRGNRASGEATRAKKEAARLWNAMADTYGLPRRTAVQI